jgi:hypothetical protein
MSDDCGEVDIGLDRDYEGSIQGLIVSMNNNVVVDGNIYIYMTATELLETLTRLSIEIVADTLEDEPEGGIIVDANDVGHLVSKEQWAQRNNGEPVHGIDGEVIDL